MQAPSDKRKKILILVAVVNVLLLYIIGLLNAVFCGHATWNPIKIIQCIIVYGFPWGIFIAVYAMVLLVVVYQLLRMWKDNGTGDVLGRAFFTRKDRQTYGDTHFETPGEFKEVALVQGPKDAYGTILGQMDSSGKKVINQRMSNTRDNKHIMVIGSSGSGKTYSFVKPYCFQCVKRRESVIITDPDGGLFRDMAGYFQDNGYVVRQLNLVNPMKSDGWDCLGTVRGSNVELLAQLFAHTVISNLNDNLETIYSTGPLALLKACILRVVLGHDYPPHMKNIKSVYELIANPAGEEFLETMFDPMNLTMEEKPCLQPYLSFKTSSPNLRGNLITNLAVELNLLQNDLLCKVLSTNDMDLTLPGKQPCAYFCRFPDSHDTYKFIVALFFSMTFIQLTEYADSKPTGLLDIPVNFLLDEFPSIGRIPDFDRKIATVRKRGMNICMILQDVTQLRQKKTYEDTWVTLMGNCATLISLGINDGETADLITKRIGETTVSVETQQHDAAEPVLALFCRKSTGEGKRALLSYEELHRIPADDCLILAQRHNPIYAKKYPYTLHPDAKKLRKIMTDDLPDITDTEARAQMREKEDTFISAYLLKHPLNKVNRDYTKIDEPMVPTSFVDRIKESISAFLKKTFGLSPKKTLAEIYEDEEDDFSFLSLGSATYDELEVQLVDEETLEIEGEEPLVPPDEPAEPTPAAEPEDEDTFVPDFGATPEPPRPPECRKRQRGRSAEQQLWGMDAEEARRAEQPKPTPELTETQPSQERPTRPTPPSATDFSNCTFYTSKPRKKPHKPPEADFEAKMMQPKPKTGPANYIAPPKKQKRDNNP